MSFPFENYVFGLCAIDDSSTCFTVLYMKVRMMYNNFFNIYFFLHIFMDIRIFIMISNYNLVINAIVLL